MSDKTAARAGTAGRQSVVARVRSDILAAIARKGLKPGDRLDTETELAGVFSVSRSTVREAFTSLEQEGLVNTVQGHGRYLSAIGSLGVDHPMTRYESITELLTGLGYEVTTAVLSVEEAAANPAEAVALELAEGDPVIRLARLRFGGEEPLVVSRNTLRRDALPGPIAHRDWGSSLSASLEAHGHHITSAAARISAVDLPDDLEQKHSLAGLGPWLLVRETSLTRSGERVLYSEDYHRGSLIGFSVLRRR
jgi:GntR family transcriptional regulator